MHTVYVVFQSHGFYEVPRISITDARSFHAFAAILEWLTQLAPISSCFLICEFQKYEVMTKSVVGGHATNKIHTPIPVIKQSNTSNTLFQSLIMNSSNIITEETVVCVGTLLSWVQQHHFIKKNKKTKKKRQTLRGKNLRKLVIRSNFHHKKIIMPTFQALTLHQKKQRDCRLTI